MDNQGPEKEHWPQWFVDLLAYLEERAAALDGTDPRPTEVVCAEVDRVARELRRHDEVSAAVALPPGSPARAVALRARRKGRPS